ncbi:reverse transcriptase domain-containing protein [Tanacetum coccineum]
MDVDSGAAFRQMKEHIAKLPMFTALEEQEELIVYLAASKEAVSAILMTEREARQMPIYFVSRALRGPEVNYTAMEKLVLALVHASKRLRRYFQAHPIIVITDQPIKNILSNPEVAGRMQKKTKKKVRTAPQRKNKRFPSMVGPCSWTGHLVLTDAEQEKQIVDVAENDEALEINLELLEEKREQAAIREEKSKRQMGKNTTYQVRNASFKPGDLVYRSNEASRVEDTRKLGPKWEGPYEVTEALGKGSYKLKDRPRKRTPSEPGICKS